MGCDVEEAPTPPPLTYLPLSTGSLLPGTPFPRPLSPSVAGCQCHHPGSLHKGRRPASPPCLGKNSPPWAGPRPHTLHAAMLPPWWRGAQPHAVRWSSRQRPPSVPACPHSPPQASASQGLPSPHAPFGQVAAGPGNKPGQELPGGAASQAHDGEAQPQLLHRLSELPPRGLSGGCSQGALGPGFLGGGERQVRTPPFGKSLAEKSGASERPFPGRGWGRGREGRGPSLSLSAPSLWGLSLLQLRVIPERGRGQRVPVMRVALTL